MVCTGHLGGEWQSQDLSPGTLALTSMLLPLPRRVTKHTAAGLSPAPLWPRFPSHTSVSRWCLWAALCSKIWERNQGRALPGALQVHYLREINPQETDLSSSDTEVQRREVMWGQVLEGAFLV